MMGEPLFKHERIEIFADRDSALRAHEYSVVIRNRETGDEAFGFTFCVSDSGKQLTVGPMLEAAKFGAAFP